MTSQTAFPLALTETLVEAATTSKAWPFEEARKLVKRYAKTGMPDEVLFETGYGPSGLPHIGTFGEVARTSMVRTAFRAITNDQVNTRLLCFSDDMDGFRKVPTNVPQQEMLAQYLGMPLTRVPDPFGTHEGFAQHNNARLCAFLDQFDFDYEFASSTDYYTSGRFDETLLRMLEVYDKVMDIILPTLGAERQATYSPFLPVCPRTGKVLQVPMIERNVSKGTVVYLDPETEEKVEVAVTGGAVKCQWKADWAMRWAALGVDYEMAGKDLIDSVKLSTKICRAIGKPQPEALSYELFLDDKGAKISKSKGNGLTIEDWLTYASPESLSLYMYQKPKTAKKLYFDVIPKAVDEYFTFLAKVQDEDTEKRIVNPTWHIHTGNPPKVDMPLTFALLLNLVSAANAHDKEVLWGFISRYAPGASAQTHPKLDELVGYAIRYFEDFVKPKKVFRAANEQEAAAMADLAKRLGEMDADLGSDALQTEVFSVGKEHGFENLREWFKALYQVLLGQDQGPRFGSFIALYGVANTRALIEKGLAGDLLKS
ncbi:lysine--tRNA ligase [Cohaesibacter celericrescens]|uniref:Lysine--tRNA ligase n=1 Tax=Cohaesibacter celericrescens TaxID=2067669 RepID=A0A2N5XL00_9HYPH|nr:lysine--tRNA ligase [Cohaesibacter celericrescens]PLW75145.1 lysine--tRNA ligase [Cohaesibacter celericrescens]